MAIFIKAYQGRSSVHSITFKDVSGVNVTLAAQDKVRIKIGRAGVSPIIDLSSDAAIGGTSVTATNPATLALGQDELDASGSAPIQAGTYDIEACIVDSGDGNKIKHAESGIFSLVSVPGGNVS